MSEVKAVIITIGDELLSGRTVDTNAAWIAAQLNRQGIEVLRRVTVGDNAEAIRAALDEELPRASVCLLTGGLGPTADDVTKPLLCAYFGGRMVVNEDVLAHVAALFRKRNRPFLDSNRRQAEVPDVCTVLHNSLGTAPGMWFEQDGKVIVSMPGVPYEMMGLMEDEVLPRLRQRYFSDVIVQRCIITAGEGESFIAERIKDLEAALPQHIHLAYLPQPGMVHLWLTGKGQDERQLIREVELYQREIAGRIEELVIALEDITLEQLLGKAFISMGKTLGLAESCTGGMIAHKLTEVMGAAGYFQGSIVCYQEHVKERVLGVRHETIARHHVVSEAVAEEMAAGARQVLRSDYGFGITGLLSPGDDESVPVGTVYMAVTDGQRTVVRRLQLQYDRIRNKEIATRMAMVLIWKFIHGKL